ncbi:DUF2815 family protein [Mammaliicoccus sciuri]|uniref:DUF2815 family protein n=1 Tax=Mammaliicoccus sciuri TaxID=1296 RepID=UPI0021D10417|nr:DUF2815 family protein [Mammaliicoccus sciuri]UXV14898.1 DUF2815 family protein [Mammaliicoccus sciuri]UXV25939.1 DUF2815 family protein [Mammaliicoccus sciuri]
MTEQLKTRMVIKNARASYVTIFEPKAINEGDEPKYSMSIIIPKSDTATIKRIEKAIENAAQNGKNTKFGSKVPANLKTPLRDGDIEREDDPAYADSYFINANTKLKPDVIGMDKLPLTNPTDLYSGCYVHVSVNFYPFAVSGNKGVAAGLGNVMKAKDGEPLGGTVSAENDFADIDAEEDEFDDLI